MKIFDFCLRNFDFVKPPSIAFEVARRGLSNIFLGHNKCAHKRSNSTMLLIRLKCDVIILRKAVQS